MSTTRCRIITTRCRLHGTSTTAFHTVMPLQCTTTLFMLYADAYLCYDMSVLFTCLHDIRAAMEGEAAYYFEQDLYHATDPVELADRNVAAIINEPAWLILLCLVLHL